MPSKVAKAKVGKADYRTLLMNWAAGVQEVPEEVVLVLVDALVEAEEHMRHPAEHEAFVETRGGSSRLRQWRTGRRQHCGDAAGRSLYSQTHPVQATPQKPKLRLP